MCGRRSSRGWRSRAAFKLMELDDRFQLIKPGARVIDLGAAPGGWAQVAVKRGASVVVGVDLLAIDPVPGRELIQGDFTEDAVQAQLTAMLGGQADLVLSDMAPNTTGHAATDHIRIVALAEAALDFALEMLAPGGGFVAKVFQGGVGAAHAGPDEAAFCQRQACQAAGEPQGEQRTVRGGDGFPGELARGRSLAWQRGGWALDCRIAALLAVTDGVSGGVWGRACLRVWVFRWRRPASV